MEQKSYVNIKTGQMRLLLQIIYKEDTHIGELDKRMLYRIK